MGERTGQAEPAPDDDQGISSVPPPQRPRWLTGLERAATQLWAEGIAVRAPGWPPVWLRVGAAGAAAAVVLVLAVAVVAGVAQALTPASAQAVRSVSTAQVRGILADPVRAWLAGHTTGLALSSQQVWWVWMTAGALFFALAVAGTVGGRVGWILFGASSVAMTYAGTRSPAGATAAGLVACAWAVLSVPALRRRSLPRVIDGPERTPPELSPPPQAPQTSAQPVGREERERDVASIAAGIYEGLLRRWAVRERHLSGHPRPAWTVTAGPGRGFRGYDETGREAAGMAISAEAIVEVLAGLGRPAGVRPVVR